LKRVFNTYNKYIEQLEREKKNSQIDTDTIITEVEKSLEAFMNKLPDPLLLSINLKIFIEKKNFTLNHIVVLPTDKTGKLMEIVDTYFTGLGDDIVMKGDTFGFYRNGSDLKINLNTIFLSLGLIPGEIIFLKGDYYLKSEAPKICITYEFEKKKDTLVDYFSCENCKLNCNTI
jgi:hypothetical protein